MTLSYSDVNTKAEAVKRAEVAVVDSNYFASRAQTLVDEVSDSYVQLQGNIEQTRLFISVYGYDALQSWGGGTSTHGDNLEWQLGPRTTELSEEKAVAQEKLATQQDLQANAKNVLAVVYTDSVAADESRQNSFVVALVLGSMATIVASTTLILLLRKRYER